MKAWQKILGDHHFILIENDKKVTVFNFIYDTNTQTMFNDTVTKIENGYMDSQGNTYESIYDYLGY